MSNKITRLQLQYSIQTWLEFHENIHFIHTILIVYAYPVYAFAGVASFPAPASPDIIISSPAPPPPPSPSLGAIPPEPVTRKEFPETWIWDRFVLILLN